MQREYKKPLLVDIYMDATSVQLTVTQPPYKGDVRPGWPSEESAVITDQQRIADSPFNSGTKVFGDVIF